MEENRGSSVVEPVEIFIKPTQREDDAENIIQFSDTPGATQLLGHIFGTSRAEITSIISPSDFPTLQSETSISIPESPTSTSGSLSFLSETTSTSIPHSPTPTPVLPATSGHSTQLPTRMLFAILPLGVLFLALSTLLFLRWRKRRRQYASSHAHENAWTTATPVAQDDVTPLRVPAATSNPFLDRLGERDAWAATPSATLKSKGAYNSSTSVPTTLAESLLQVAPSVSSHAVPDSAMAELSAAMRRAGLSVNELMSSLNRVARADADTDNYGRARTSGEVMPPQYEP